MCLRQCWWVLVRNVWQRTESPNNMEDKAWLIVIWAMSFFNYLTITDRVKGEKVFKLCYNKKM